MKEIRFAIVLIWSASFTLAQTADDRTLRFDGSYRTAGKQHEWLTDFIALQAVLLIAGARLTLKLAVRGVPPPLLTTEAPLRLIVHCQLPTPALWLSTPAPSRSVAWGACRS